MEFKEQIRTFQERIKTAIASLLPPVNQRPVRLNEAMHYSMNAGGKRLRPILALAAFERLGGDSTSPDPMPAAIALECLHTYSLIHDDLPAMDNSDLRRGSPTCHKAFDEATAILAGDALLTYAFQLLAEHYARHPALVGKLVRELARAAGPANLIGGQMEDIQSERSGNCTEETLHYIQEGKTAALIRCSLLFGAILAQAPESEEDRIRGLGFHLGVAFQQIDDVLDVSQNTEILGKPAGLDHQNDTATAVHFYGVEGARVRAQRNTRQAQEYCSQLSGEPGFLEALIEWMEHRLH